jgi:hypothetical protein
VAFTEISAIPDDRTGHSRARSVLLDVTDPASNVQTDLVEFAVRPRAGTDERSGHENDP